MTFPVGILVVVKRKRKFMVQGSPLLVNMDQKTATENKLTITNTQYHIGIHYKNMQWGLGL